MLRSSAAFEPPDGVALDEEVADRGQRVAAAEVPGVAVGLFEPVREVLTEAGELGFGADEQFRSAVPPADHDIDLLLVRPAQHPRVDRGDGGHVR